MKELSRRGLLGLGGALGAAALLAACGTGEQAASNDTGTPAKLRVWFMKDSVSDKAQAWLKSEFESKFPGSTLTIEQQEWDGIVPKLQTALASAESTPDIIELGNTQAPTFCAVGALADLTEIKGTLGGSDLTQSLVDLGSSGGKMYAAPFYAGSRIMFYRKDFFATAGVKVPTTIDELTAAAATLQAANPAANPHFSGLFLPGISSQSAFAWVFTNGGRLATEEGGAWKGGLSSPESQKAIAQLQQLWKTGSTTGTVTDSTIGSQPYTAFNTDEAGMFFGFNFHLKKIKKELVDAGKVGYFSFPAAKSGDGGHPFAGGSNVAVSNKSKAPGLAKEALKLIFSKEFQEFFATEGGWVPGNLKYADALGTDELSKITVDAVRNSVGTPAAKNWALVESAKTVDDFFVAMGAGKDPVALAKTADDKMTAILNSN
ncbi:extracellular solute-binding protein [Micrococcaceae bacterium Sec5.7]